MLETKPRASQSKGRCPRPRAASPALAISLRSSRFPPPSHNHLNTFQRLNISTKLLRALGRKETFHVTHLTNSQDTAGTHTTQQQENKQAQSNGGKSELQPPDPQQEEALTAPIFWGKQTQRAKRGRLVSVRLHHTQKGMNRKCREKADPPSETDSTPPTANTKQLWDPAIPF